MKWFATRFTIFCVLLLCAGRASAQTVESVLRAMQERNYVLEQRATYFNQAKVAAIPISWENGIAEYPQDNTINNLQHAIDALNIAKKKYDLFVRAFREPPSASEATLNGPPANDDKRPYFTEANWRWKIREFASDINNNLKSLKWPLLGRVVRQEAYYNMIGAPDEWIVSMFTDRNGSANSKLVVDAAYFRVEMPPIYGGAAGLFEGRTGVFEGTTGVQGTPQGFNPLPAFANMTQNLTGNVRLKKVEKPKAYASHPYYPLDLSGTLSDSEPHTTEFTLGDYTSTLLPDILYTQNVIKEPRVNHFVGWDYELNQEVTYPLNPTDPLANGPSWMQLTAGWRGQHVQFLIPAYFYPSSWNPPDVDENGNVVNGYYQPTAADDLFMGLIVDLLRDYGILPSDFGITNPLGGIENDFGYTGLVVYEAIRYPSFSPVLPANAVGAGEFKHALGEVEVLKNDSATGTSADLIANTGICDEVKIHIGRGLNDTNQSGYLTIPLSGFGPMIFRGVEGEFTLDYNTDTASYPDHLVAPITDSTGQADERITTGAWFTDASALWVGLRGLSVVDNVIPIAAHRARGAYLTAWSQPRLTKVTGGDVIVVIEQSPSSYKRTLKFYWKSDQGLANPFKQIVISNPTVPEAGGFAESHAELKIEENGIIHTLKEDLTVNETDGRRMIYTARGSIVLDAERVSGSFLNPVTNENEYKNEYILSRTEAGIIWTKKVKFDVKNRVIEIVDSVPNERDRKTTATWGEVVLVEGKKGVVDEDVLTKISYTSPPSTTDPSLPLTWSEHGRTLTFNKYGLTSDTLPVEGQVFYVSSELSGNVRTTSSYLGQALFKTETVTASNALSVFTASVSGPGNAAQTVATATYRTGTDANALPLSLQSIVYPGGYRTDYEIKASATGSTSKVVSGYGPLSQTESFTSVGTLGGLLSRTVKQNGVEVAKDVTTDSTAWGAPKKVEHLRADTATGADIDTIEYYETPGINYGKLKSITSAGVTQQFKYDERGRVTENSDNYEKVTYQYSNPLSVTATTTVGETTLDSSTQTVSGFGQTLSSTSTFGGGASTTFDPATRVATSTINGTQEKSASFGASGWLKSVTTGQGSLGGAYEFGVENGVFFTKAKQRGSSDTDTGFDVTSYFDPQGRLIRRKSPSPANGAAQDESWDYQDQNRKVIYSPRPGPTAQNVTTEISPDGTITTVSLGELGVFGGTPVAKTERSTANGTFTVVESVNTNKSGQVTWTEVSRRTVTPKTGTVIAVPEGRTDLATKVVVEAPSASQATTVEMVARPSRTKFTVTKTNGRLTEATGKVSGSTFGFNYQHVGSLMKAATGSVNGKSTGFSLDENFRLGNAYGPTSNTSYAYAFGQDGGTTVTANDTKQGAQRVASANKFGDVTAIAGDGILDQSIQTTETPQGFTESINGRLRVNRNFYGDTTSKIYGDNTLNESYALNSDGSIQSVAIGGRIIRYNHTPTTTAKWVDGAEAETRSPIGLLISTAGPTESRSYTHTGLDQTGETYTAGPFTGWQIDRVLDTEGRVTGLSFRKDGNNVRSFTLSYDDNSQLIGSVSSQLTASYGPRSPEGQFSTLTRGTLTTTWTYDDSERIARLNNATTSGHTFNYNYSSRDSRHRIRSRIANNGISWHSLSYDADDQLKKVHLGSGRVINYKYDEHGSRADGDQTTPNILNQITSRTLTQRGFGIYGWIDKKAEVRTRNTITPDWQSLAVNPDSGTFAGWWDIPDDQSHSGSASITARVRGVLPAETAGSPPAIADMDIELLVPPKTETLTYDATGNLASDGFWNYSWDHNDRLITKTRTAAFGANISAETVSFVYDTEGRRISKTRTTTAASNGAQTVATSKVLWSDWLPMMEERYINNVYQGRRWFQWGADLSGTMDGAGGIGGLLGIIEENASGGLVRTLLPVQDGLGNVTAVINAANGYVVARYDYGPFGEPIGASGDTEACPFRYQTKWFDAESEHYYFGYRYYDPRLGRWLSRDPLGEEGGFNLYAYCGNDPVNRWDYLGMEGNERKSFGLFEYLFAAHVDREDLVAAKYKTGHYAVYGAPAKVIQAPRTQAAIRIVGGGAEVVGAGLYTYATWGLGGLLGGGVMAANGLDNYEAGLRSWETDSYQPAYLEKGITNVAGDGWVGNTIYMGTQLALPYAAAKVSAIRVPKFSLSSLTLPGNGRFLPHVNFKTAASLHPAEVLTETKKLLTPEMGPQLNRDSVLEGFQDHHIISDKNALTKNHDLLKLSDFDLQSRANKIFLPTDGALHPTRSIHLGRHTISVSRNVAEQMDAVVDFGLANNWTLSQYDEALRAIIGEERQLLKSGDRALNINARPWAQ